VTPHEAEQRARVAELETRIAELESLDEASFGHFGRWDWIACVAFALVLPALALWWFAN
jgi:hypothetical protein